MDARITPTARIAISVLTYERPATTTLFFNKLWEYTKETLFDLFVIDNGSKLGTKEVLLKLPSTTPAGGSVHLLLLKENAGWCPAKNLGLAVAQEYAYVALMENDCTCEALTQAYGDDWLAQHIHALESLDLDVVQGRHAPKTHKDEGYYWRINKEGKRWWPCDPDDAPAGQLLGNIWPLRMHDELLTRMLVMRGSVIRDVGGFNEKAFPAPLGMFADVEFSDRVLRKYYQRHGVVWGVSLDERIFEFLEINQDLYGVKEDYPGSEAAHEMGKAAHGRAFEERRGYIWGHPDPDVYVPFSDWAKETVKAFWGGEGE